MKIELRKDCDYSLLVPTSMGIRITPVNGQPVHCSDTFKMYATSAESNVASVSSFLGLPVKVLTTFVKDSPIARFIKDRNCDRYAVFLHDRSSLNRIPPWKTWNRDNVSVRIRFLFIVNTETSLMFKRQDAHSDQ